MNSKIILAAVVVIVILAAGGYFLLNTNKSSTTTPAAETQTTQPTQASSEETGEVMSENEITVEGGEFKFTPSEITVKKGEKVKITFKNTGSFPHDFTIEGMDVATKRINPGESDTVEFTPEEAGEFQFICSVGNHEEQGMVGTLTIE